MATGEQLVETLNQLSPEDFSEFKSRVEAENAPSPATRRRLKAANTQDVVELMQKMLGGGNLEATRRVLMKMGRTDLVQRLSRMDSGAKGGRLSKQMFQNDFVILKTEKPIHQRRNLSSISSLQINELSTVRSDSKVSEEVYI